MPRVRECLNVSVPLLSRCSKWTRGLESNWVTDSACTQNRVIIRSFLLDPSVSVPETSKISHKCVSVCVFVV